MTGRPAAHARDEQIKNFLKLNPGSRMHDIEKALNISKATVDSATHSMPDIYEDDNGFLYVK